MLNADPILPPPLVWNPRLLYPRYSYQMHILVFLALWGLKWIDNLKGACSCKTCWFQPGQVNLIFKKQDYGNGGEVFPISWNQNFFLHPHDPLKKIGNLLQWAHMLVPGVPEHRNSDMSHASSFKYDIHASFVRTSFLWFSTMVKMGF